MKWMPVVLAACLSAGCASGPVVQSDSDPAADFSAYHDYAWKQPPPIGNPLLKQRVVAAVDAELAGKGWRQVAEADADVLLVGNVAAREDASLDYFYEGDAWNGWSWKGRGRFGVERVELRTFRIGTLVLDMFDARSQQAVWRAVAQGPVPDSEDRRQRDAMQAIREMFQDFPPRRDPAH